MANKILSIYYYAIGYVKGSAYPNNHYKSFNFDLKKGKKVSLTGLFNNNKSVKPFVNAYIAKELVKKRINESKEEFRGKKRYSFYLSPKGITIINLFEVHVLQGVEINIPFKKLKPYVTKRSILWSISRKAKN